MGSCRVAADVRTAAGAFTAPKIATAISSAAPNVSVLRRRTKTRLHDLPLAPFPPAMKMQKHPHILP